MKSVFLSLILLLCFEFSWCQTKAVKADPWTTYMTPGKVHKLLQQYTGNWNMQITMWMDAGSKPQKFTVATVNTKLLGGRYLEIKQKGNMMGMDYAATTVLGFNNASNRIELTNISNMGTGTLYLSGTCNAVTRKAVLNGSMANPVNGKPTYIKQVITFTDANNLLIENYDKEGSQPERRSITYRLTRKL